MQRRQFLQRCSAATLAALAPRVWASQTTAKVRYVDVHTHIGTYTNNNKALSVPELLSWMDEHNIEKAFVLPLVSPESTTYLQTPEVALKATEAHRDRLIPFCALDPRAIIVGGQQGLNNIVKRYVDQGAKGFGEHKVGLDFDDPLMLRVYEAVEAAGIPILFHMDNIRGKDSPGLPRLEAALKTFPKLNFIGHGPGFWASIAGELKQQDLSGYPKGKVPPGGALDRLMENYPNLFCDLSAGSGSNAISRDLEFGREFLIRRQDRILFGTDYLQPGQAVPQFDLFETQLNLPDDVFRKIARENALRLVGEKA
jgi:uncharacterized protein